MQNRNVIKIFAILFAVVCLYQLSFTWIVGGVEDDAVAYAAEDADITFRLWKIFKQKLHLSRVTKVYETLELRTRLAALSESTDNDANLLITESKSLQFIISSENYIKKNNWKFAFVC
mgnify:CR=1 FL=1